MTPGSYIRKRRQARKLSHVDVTQECNNLWVQEQREIEQDRVEPTASQCSELAKAIEFPVHILRALIDGLNPQICRQCACSDPDPCIADDGIPCHWIEEDLCSACADPVAEEEEQVAA